MTYSEGSSEKSGGVLNAQVPQVTRRTARDRTHTFEDTYM